MSRYLTALRSVGKLVFGQGLLPLLANWPWAASTEPVLTEGIESTQDKQKYGWKCQVEQGCVKTGGGTAQLDLFLLLVFSLNQLQDPQTGKAGNQPNHSRLGYLPGILLLPWHFWGVPFLNFVDSTNKPCSSANITIWALLHFAQRPTSLVRRHLPLCCSSRVLGAEDLAQLQSS